MEKQQRIKKIIIKRKDDFLTALEKNWRDWAFKPLTNLFEKIGITANQITYTGFVLIFIAIYMYIDNFSIKSQLIILTLAAISDAIDGPTARNNDNVTVKGTWLDHIRDGMLIIWASFLVYKLDLIDPRFILIIFLLQIIFFWIKLKDFTINYLNQITEEESLLTNFTLDDMQASIIERMQFASWVISYGFLFSSLIFPISFGLFMGQAFFFIAIIFSALNIFEAYQKTV